MPRRVPFAGRTRLLDYRVLYFAYGSNLDVDNWKLWCERGGFDPASIEPVQPAWLPDFEPVFHYRSRLRRGGSLDVRPKQGTATPGALFRVHDWGGLDAKEGVSGGYYERITTTALTEDGEAHRAITYRVNRDRIRGFVAPGQEYLEIVQRGLSRFGHADDQLLAVANDEDAAPLPGSLFAYGTLRHGAERHDLLAPHLVGSPTRARVMGASLVRIDWYPGLVLRANGSVRGDLFALADPGTAFTALDAYEDFLGYDEPRSLYRRSLVQVLTDHQKELAWTYVYLGQTDSLPLIESGEWPAKRVP